MNWRFPIRFKKKKNLLSALVFTSPTLVRLPHCHPTRIARKQCSRPRSTRQGHYTVTSPDSIHAHRDDERRRDSSTAAVGHADGERTEQRHSFLLQRPRASRAAPGAQCVTFAAARPASLLADMLLSCTPNGWLRCVVCRVFGVRACRLCMQAAATTELGAGNITITLHAAPG